MKNRNTLPGLLLAGLFLLALSAPVLAAERGCVLAVSSVPEDAVVRIDGVQQGMTPCAVSLPCTNFSLTVEKNGYLPYRETVTLHDPEYRQIVANLESRSHRGSVFIRSEPAGGQLFIDGTLRGTTPLRVDELLYGRHSVLIRNEGYLDFQDIVTAGPDAVHEYTEYLVPEPATGFLGVSSSPDGARVFLDGTPFGTTPTRLGQVPAANHTILLVKDGYRNYTAEIRVRGAEALQVHADLQPLPTTGNLILDSDPPGASVRLNGTFKGISPLVLENVPAGPYSLAFSLRNYSPVDVPVNLTGGETREILAVFSPGGSERGRVQERVYATVSNASHLLPGMTDPVPSLERTYTWYANGHEATVRLRIPQSLYDHYKASSHERGVQYLPRYALTDEDRAYLHDLIGLLKDAGESKTYRARNDYRNVVAFVQAIPYTSDPANSPVRDYWQYPIETLADGTGDCEDHAILSAALLKEMGYDVALVLLEDPSRGHAAVAVACDSCNGYYYPVDGRKYYYLETTGYNAPIGVMDKYYETVAADVIVL
jgi:hypothetical protein